MHDWTGMVQMIVFHCEMVSFGPIIAITKKVRMAALWLRMDKYLQRVLMYRVNEVVTTSSVSQQFEMYFNFKSM